MKKFLSVLIVLVLLIAAAFAEPAPETTAPAETEPEATDMVEETPQPQQAAGTMEDPILVGDAYSFETEILADGTARLNAADADFGTVKLTVTLMDSLEPEYYAENYATTYKLTGTEACAVLQVRFDETTGASSVIPQDVILVRVADENGAIADGYQMMDAEIGGNYDVAVQLGTAGTLYKRYEYHPDSPAKYLVLTTYQGGKATDVYFRLERPVVYETLQRGSRSDAVKALQEKLVEKGYLTGTADGVFGAKTEAAVKSAQEAAAMEQTGIADNDFQHYLYDE
ncbi:MAG: peptidoglycan-binding domain-containing protein [Eubacteriales bacterium]|nr:peptidoglycan-binding domain-containing protein [Eubacteriales bacterium]